jgi:hypothetical protein
MEMDEGEEEKKERLKELGLNYSVGSPGKESDMEG